MNIRKKSSLLLLVLTATPLVLAGADSGPKPGSKAPEIGAQSDRAEHSMVIRGNCNVSLLRDGQRDRGQPSTTISSDSEGSVLIGKSDRLTKLELGASKTDPHKIAIRLVFASGTKLAVDLQRHQAELIAAEMSREGTEDGPVQIHCKALEFDFIGRDIAKAQPQGANVQP